MHQTDQLALLLLRDRISLLFEVFLDSYLRKRSLTSYHLADLKSYHNSCYGRLIRCPDGTHIFSGSKESGPRSLGSTPLEAKNRLTGDRYCQGKDILPFEEDTFD